MEGIFAMAPTSTLRDSPGESITVRFSTATTVLSRDRYDESVCARAARESSKSADHMIDIPAFRKVIYYSIQSGVPLPL